MIGAVRQDGSTACMTVEGAVSAEIVRSHVRDVLLPTMCVGDILVVGSPALTITRSIGLLVAVMILLKCSICRTGVPFFRV